MEMPLTREQDEKKPVRGPHGGWQGQEIEALRRGIEEANRQGQSLRSVFERMGKELGRKPNSIRNFYYAQVRASEGGAQGRALPFEVFTPGEVEQLVENVLTARAQGLSVRACVRNLAGGDRTRMLRYQNKYRSTVRTRPELVQRVMDRLTQKGVPFVNPYAAAKKEPDQQALERLQLRAGQSGDPQLAAFFSSLDHLLALAYAPREEPETPREPGADGGQAAQRKADRLSARCDLLRIALTDERERAGHLRSEAGEMVTLIKEYVALPEADRLTHCNAFCRQAAERLSAVECALMPGDAPEQP